MHPCGGCGPGSTPGGSTKNTNIIWGRRHLGFYPVLSFVLVQGNSSRENITEGPYFVRFFLAQTIGNRTAQDTHQ